MSIAVKDGLGILRYLEAVGAGTELDPYKVVQDVFIQDQTTAQISVFLGQDLDTGVVFRSGQSSDVVTLNITTTGATPVVGNFIFAKEGMFFTQVEITTVTPVAGNDYDVGISIPLDHVYTVAADVTLQNCNMNVDGSSTPVEFSVTPLGSEAGTEWDITRMIISMTHTSQGDDGLFGNLAALTNGVYFRIEDGTNYNLFNAKENADFAMEGYDIAYPARSGGGGTAGTRARITFNGQDKRGVVLRLAADSGDKFLSSVRDNLTGLTSHRVKVQGQLADNS